MHFRVLSGHALLPASPDPPHGEFKRAMSTNVPPSEVGCAHYFTQWLGLSCESIQCLTSRVHERD